jgi:Arc/MetJ-type ribon-helix-helix transcriptional regulator
MTNLRPTRKIQLTLPEEVTIQIDEEIETFSTRSNWFLRVALEELKRRKGNETKKIIELNI